MGDINQINDVASANINQVNDVAKANINEVNDQGVAASGATIWVGIQDDRRISTVSNSDLLAGNSWATYDSFSGGQSPHPGSNNDYIHVAYGKDGSGNAYWVASPQTDGCELAHHDDPTAAPWTGVNTDSDGNNISGRAFAIQWGNDVWIAVGGMNSKDIRRSTNGSTWDTIDLSSVSGITTTGIYALAQNGAGTWWFAQENKIWQSTQDGASGSWSLIHTLLNSSNADPGNIRALHFTNNTLVAGVDTNDAFVFAAAVSDLTDWSNETTLTSGGNAFDTQTQSAAYQGRVVCVGSNKKWTFDVDGKSITMDENNVQVAPDSTSHGNFKGISTDGSTWVAVCSSGDVFTSTNGGDSWTASHTNIGSKDFCDIAPDVYLPL